MSKIICTMILSAMLVCTCPAAPASAFVEANNALAGVTPMSVISYYTTSQLSVSGTSATCTSTGKGAANITTKITVNQVLQKQNSAGGWTAVKSWTKSESTYQVTAVNTASGLSSGTYRLKTNFTFYNGTTSENIVKYSSTKTI